MRSFLILFGTQEDRSKRLLLYLSKTKVRENVLSEAILLSHLPVGMRSKYWISSLHLNKARLVHSLSNAM